MGIAHGRIIALSQGLKDRYTRTIVITLKMRKVQKNLQPKQEIFMEYNAVGIAVESPPPGIKIIKTLPAACNG